MFAVILESLASMQRWRLASKSYYRSHLFCATIMPRYGIGESLWLFCLMAESIMCKGLHRVRAQCNMLLENILCSHKRVFNSPSCMEIHSSIVMQRLATEIQDANTTTTRWLFPLNTIEAPIISVYLLGNVLISSSMTNLKCGLDRSMDLPLH